MLYIYIYILYMWLYASASSPADADGTLGRQDDRQQWEKVAISTHCSHRLTLIETSEVPQRDSINLGATANLAAAQVVKYCKVGMYSGGGSTRCYTHCLGWKGTNCNEIYTPVTCQKLELTAPGPGWGTRTAICCQTCCSSVYCTVAGRLPVYNTSD